MLVAPKAAAGTGALSVGRIICPGRAEKRRSPTVSTLGRKLPDPNESGTLRSDTGPGGQEAVLRGNRQRGSGKGHKQGFGSDKAGQTVRLLEEAKCGPLESHLANSKEQATRICACQMDKRPRHRGARATGQNDPRRSPAQRAGRPRCGGRKDVAPWGLQRANDPLPPRLGYVPAACAQGSEPTC